MLDKQESPDEIFTEMKLFGDEREAILKAYDQRNSEKQNTVSEP